MVGQEYHKNNTNAFGSDRDGRFFYDEKRQDEDRDITRMFELHPQVAKAVLAVNMHFLRMDLLPSHRQEAEDMMKSDTAPEILLLWGDHDVVVPYEHAAEFVQWNADRVTLTPLVEMGHESLLEDPAKVAEALLEHFVTKPKQ